MGKFQMKCHEVGMNIKQTEPYTPWSNATEGTIHELKHGAGRPNLHALPNFGITALNLKHIFVVEFLRLTTFNSLSSIGQLVGV